MTELAPYSDPRPNSKIGSLRTALMYLIEEHRRDDALPTSVRFLFYELVARRIISKQGNRPDKIVSEELSRICANADLAEQVFRTVAEPLKSSTERS
jgi:hypothetical protein